MVYRATDSDPDMIAMITKNSLLGFIYLLSVLIFATTTILAIQTNSIHYGLVNGVYLGIDLSVSFWSVILAYKDFKGWYRKMCGCCDSKCKSCWNRMIRKSDLDIMTKEIQISTTGSDR